MELVDIVHRHHVEIAFHGIERDEMAAHVEVHAAVGEHREVCDFAGREVHHIDLLVGGDALAERLDAVENPSGVLARDHDTLGCDLNLIAFGMGIRCVLFLNVQQQEDAGAGGGFDGLYLEVQTGDVGQVFRQKLGLALQGVFRIVVNNGVFGQRERCVFVQVDMLWEWNDLVVSFGDFLFAAGKECCTKHNSQKQP